MDAGNPVSTSCSARGPPVDVPIITNVLVVILLFILETFIDLSDH